MSLGEHCLVGFAANQERIDSLHKLRTDVRDFLVPVNPIESAILAGNVVVKTVSETESYFSHRYVQVFRGFAP